MRLNYRVVRVGAIAMAFSFLILRRAYLYSFIHSLATGWI